MDTLHFETNVQLKNIIGKDLINDDDIAILELVKNAYDANSQSARVTFQNIKTNDDSNLSDEQPYTEKTSRIIVQDFGVGMDRTDIEGKWLNIAYSEKKLEKTKYNRRLAGNKGVGRFSCDRLGKYLNLYSRRTGGKVVHLFIDWQLFEVEDKDKTIQDVDISFEEISANTFEKRTGHKLFSSGTILEINRLRTSWTAAKETSDGQETWSKEKLLSLRKQLERLINPNQAYSKKGFKITLAAPEFRPEDKISPAAEQINGDIGNKVFQELDFKTTSIISEVNTHTITTTLQDKGKTIFKLVEKNTKFPTLTSAKIVLYFLSTYSKAYFTKQTGIRSVDFGSVYLFINGFRIPPYGDVGDDWLKMERRKGQGVRRFLGTRDIVGRIEVLDELESFKIVSSREGVVRNESYEQLTNREGFFYKTLRRLEKYVIEGIAWDSIPPYLRNKIQEIEAKVLSGSWRTEDEVYVESDPEKFRRVYSIIHSIISAKRDEVVSLYVNESLILQQVAEDKAKAEQEFEQLLEDFSKKKVNVEAMNIVLRRKAQLDTDLAKQLSDFSKYTTDEATTAAILQIHSLRKENREQTEQIKELVLKVEELEKKGRRAGVESKEKEKLILFQQKLLSKDAQQLIEFHHAIGISADAIDKYLMNLKDDLLRGRKPTKDELFEFIEDISYESKKIIALTNLATAANFDADTDEIDADLTEFIKQYAEKVSSGFLRTYDGSKKIKIQIDDNTGSEFVMPFKPIEIAIILDNLFNNSRKARAQDIVVSFKSSEGQGLQVNVKDNGRGVTKGNFGKIFDFGFTTTSGSGLGLHQVRNIMKNYRGEISVNEGLKVGAEFILTFHRYEN